MDDSIDWSVWPKWHSIILASIIPAFIIMLLAGAIVLTAIPDDSFTETAAEVIGFFIAGVILTFGAGLLITGFISLFSYYFDSQRAKRADFSWQPFWPIWVAGHMILSPIIVCPIYYLRRRNQIKDAKAE